MQINPNIYSYKSNFNSISDKNAQKPVAFSGLTAVLKRQAIESPSDILALVNKLPNTFVGSFPKEWVELIPIGQRAQTIKQVQKGFSEAIQQLQRPNLQLEKEINAFVNKNAQLMHSNIPMEKKLNLLNEYISTTQKETDVIGSMVDAHKILAESLHKNGISKNVELSYVGAGQFGDVYKVKVDDNEYALKVFKRFNTNPGDNIFERMIDETDIDDFREEMKLHGQITEPNRSLYWQKNINEHQNSRMYFSDLKNGGTLSEFVRFDSSKPKKYVDPQLVGLEHTDLKKRANSINGHVIDGGGQKIVNKTITSNTNARKVYYKVGKQDSPTKQAKVWNRIFKTEKANRSDVETGLMNALELMDVETIGKLDIPPSVIDRWTKSPSLSYPIKMQLVKKKLFF